MLIFPNEKQYHIDHINQAKEFLEALQNQGNKVDLSDGNIVGLSYSNVLEKFLTATGKEYHFPNLKKE